MVYESKKKSLFILTIYLCESTDEKVYHIVRDTVSKMRGRTIKEIDVDEHQFWSDLIEVCLKPDVNAFGQHTELKSKALRYIKFKHVENAKDRVHCHCDTKTR